MPNPLDGPEAETGAALMAEGAARLVAGVERFGSDWVVAVVAQILDAWGRLDATDYATALEAARRAGNEAAARVAEELRTLFAHDPADQRATPLEIIRSLRREPTAVLRETGVPEVERDAYDVRAFPDDVYGIVPKSPGDLGDEDLGGALLAWGLGKSRVLRSRKSDSTDS